MTPDLRARIAALGSELTPDMMRGTQGIFAGLYPGLAKGLLIDRDRQYGPHERNRLDVFRREGVTKAPVLVFVHGGGFVMGDKRSAETPFYDNIGSFAAAAGLIGVTITYRLAPGSTWPSGPDDMAAAIDWLHDNMAEIGGDPDRIYLMGQSAGAVHVASYVAHRTPRIAGAMMISGIYDVAKAHANPFHKAYYGEDESAYPAASTQDGLIDSTVPLLLSVSEFDGADFQKQAAELVGAFGRRHGRYPRMLYLTGHNHLSPVLAVGGPADTLGPEILNFVAATAAKGE